jgi:hypothetical protein
VADDEPDVGAVEADLLDPQVVPDVLVAASVGEDGLDEGVAVANAHAGDVVPASAAQVGEVVRGGEAAVHDGDDPAEFPVAQIVADLGEYRLVVAVAGPAPAAHRDALLRHGQADDDLRQTSFGTR